MPYQTLAASILHMVAKGELKLSLVGSDEVKRQGGYGAARPCRPTDKTQDFKIQETREEAAS
jgi:hypothetical protein